MFKTWQIFVFSLIPLALVFIGVIGGSFHGVDSGKEIFPTSQPAPTLALSTPSSGGTPTGAVALQIAAKNILFDKRTLSAPANAQVTVRFDNQDAGVLHNVAVYTNSRATQKLFVGEIFVGPATREYSFTSPAAGSYFFRCDVHPDSMTGSFTVR